MSKCWEFLTRFPDLPKLLFLADVGGPSSPHVGDEAMLEANVSLFRKLLPGCEIDVAAGPAWEGIRLGAKVLPRMEFSPDSEAEREALLQASHAVLGSAHPAVRAALSCDALIISGGGNLSSIWPHFIYERLAMARLASSKGVPVIILGQTLGPELGAREREMLTELLQLSAWTGLRETYSYSLALELGANPETLSYQVDDATFLAPMPAQTNGLIPSGRPWIAVTVHPVGEPGIGNPVIARMAASLRTIAKTAEAELVFLPHVDFPRESGALGDGAFGEAIDRVLDANPPLRVHPVLPAAQTMWLTQQASLVISTRYHPLVFALAGAVPAVGLWTDQYTRRKLQGALIHAGRLSDAMSFEEALAGGLTAKALQLWHSTASLREELRTRVTTWRGDEEVRLAKLECRLRAGMHHQQSVPITLNSNGLRRAWPETAFDILKSQKIVQENEIRKLQARLLEETTAAKGFCKLLAESDRRITELAGLNNQLVTERRHREQELAGLNNQLVAERRHHEQELAGLNNQLVAAKARLGSVYSSRSWRLTAPLRWCDDIQRRAVRRLRKYLVGDD
jgi:polysaccharide pyruvyl transferase WcaK-like protein